MVTDLAHTGVGTFSWPPVGTLNWPLTLAGTITEIVGSQLAVLTPVLAPVTTVDTPVRSDALTAVATTAADTVIVPAA